MSAHPLRASSTTRKHRTSPFCANRPLRLTLGCIGTAEPRAQARNWSTADLKLGVFVALSRSSSELPDSGEESSAAAVVRVVATCTGLPFARPTTAFACRRRARMADFRRALRLRFLSSSRLLDTLDTHSVSSSFNKLTGARAGRVKPSTASFSASGLVSVRLNAAMS